MDEDNSDSATTRWDPWEPTFTDPEKQYRLERSNAEDKFGIDFRCWVSRNTQNPPRKSIVLDNGTEIRTEARYDLQIICELESSIGQFLTAALWAYGGLLLARKLPALEALKAFESHSEELLAEAQARKWLFGIRRLNLSEKEFADRFPVALQGWIDNVRYEFEELAWQAESELLLGSDPPEESIVTNSTEIGSLCPAIPPQGCRQPTQISADLKEIAPEVQGGEGPTGPVEIGARAARREAVVNPILQRKRWKRGRLATKAGVSKNSVYKYLDGTRSEITSENRKAIAQALDLSEEQLPD